MGPNKNPALFNAVKSDADVIRAEKERGEMASNVIATLSKEFESTSAIAPFTEPTLPAKLFSLAHIDNDPLGLAGFSAEAAVNLGRNHNLSVFGSAAPAHDRFEDSSGAVCTRAVRLYVKEEYDDKSSEDGLEIFGLNMYIPDPESEDKKTTSLLIPALNGTGYMAHTEGDPIQGITSIFAVRNPKHGMVKIYSVKIEINPLRESGSSTRDTLNEIAINLPNGLTARIMQLEGSEFEQAISEFSSAADALSMERQMGESTNLTLEEQAAIRDLRSVSPNW